MNHSDAVRLQAAEKYVLGELQGTLRDEYEEHYFDCLECAADLKATAAFVSLSRMAFRDEAATAVAATRDLQARPRPSWIERFRLAVAVPTFAAAALAVVVAYQTRVTIPDLQRAASLTAASAYTQTLQLGASGVRSGDSVGGAPFVIDARQGSSLLFDFTPSDASLPAYVCQFRDPSGRILLQQAVSASAANQAFALQIPGGVITVPGKYQVVFLGADPVTGQPSAGPAVLNLPITIAIRQ
jgi:hypothetical protein